jgi:hypothetical protein
MDARPYRRRATGEMAIDPALHELVMNSGSLLDRLICGNPSPIPEEQAAMRPRTAALGAESSRGTGRAGGTGGAGGAAGGRGSIGG